MELPEWLVWRKESRRVRIGLDMWHWNVRGQSRWCRKWDGRNHRPKGSTSKDGNYA